MVNQDVAKQRAVNNNIGKLTMTYLGLSLNIIPDGYIKTSLSKDRM